MQKSTFAVVLGASAFTALAVAQYSIWHQQREINAKLEQMGHTLERAERADPRPSVSYQVKTGSSGVTKEELRAVLREELLANRANEPSDAAPGASSRPVEVAASPESERAFQKAQSVVRSAINARVWGDEQVAEWRALRGQLTPEQLQSVQAELFPAINSQQLKVEASGPPF